jgi:radical SAM-linked protein
MAALKLAVIFSKKGQAKFFSHLDLLRLFQRACRRAKIELKLSQGFSPRAKISFARALKLGLESENETATFHLNQFLEPEEFIRRLNEQLPEGIRIKEAHY